ncbi:MAG: cation transporting ATPase C-terminal domain-containing protein, partial [Candidatus Promineifilaceae bacterium]
EIFTNRQLWLAYGWILLILVLVTEIGLFQRVFETEPLTLQQWGICLIAVVFFLLVSEVLKLLLRLTKKRSQ